MVTRFEVALVYNLRPKSDPLSAEKKEIADDGSGEDGERQGRERGQTAVAMPIEARKTRTDTYAEWDTEETILAVKSALEERHRVSLIEADEQSYQRLLDVRPTVVFNIAEGFRGASREAQVPAMLEMLGIPYTGSDPITLGICLDKSRAKEILSYYHIPTPKFSVINSIEELARSHPLLPGIVKPLHEGSSKGIFDASVVRTPEELHRQVEFVLNEYTEPALVEEYLPGREFTVALIGNGSSLQVFPIVEMRFDSLPEGVNPIYSYEAKWVWDQTDHPIDVHKCPAKIEKTLETRIRQICIDAFNVLRCRDWCRIDVRLDEHGEPHIIELNPLPGILPNPEEHSCFPRAARAAGISYNAMINSVLDAAAQRYGFS